MKNSENKKNPDWTKTLVDAATNLFRASCGIIEENYKSYKVGTLPLMWITLWCLSFFYININNIDLIIFSKIHFFKYIFKYPAVYSVYTVLGFLAGFIAWGLMKSMQLQTFKRAIVRAFENAQVKTVLGDFPVFISHKSLDAEVSEIKFFKNGVPLEKFTSGQGSLESTFHCIDNIYQDPKNPSFVTIRYANTPLTNMVDFKEIPTLSKGEFPIGKSRSTWITSSFTETPHILIGGTSRYGKSSFIRSLILYNLIHDHNVEFWQIDLKEGIEANTFAKAERCRCANDGKRGVEFLKEADQLITERLQFFKANNCLSIEELLKQKKITWSEEIKSLNDLKRVVIIIDEAALFYLTILHSSMNFDPKAARILTQKIGATGRAVGVHLILAAQRPDAHSIDMGIKTHMSGRLAFVMSDGASSMTILDSHRATKLPNIRGRAIWMGIYDPIELQVPYISNEDTFKLLKEKNLLKTNTNNSTVLTVEPATSGSACSTITTDEKVELASGVPAADSEVDKT
jgi:hypothetical protein